MDMDLHESIGTLMQEGIAAARAGEQEEARKLLRRVTELAPGRADGWIWLASVTEGSADKKAYLEQALELDPDNVEARRALEKVIEREGELAARVGDEPFVCTVHPDRETMLRCNRCGRPMCTECAVRHPVGMRCRECVSETRSPIYQVDTATAGRVLAAATVVGTAFGALAVTVGNLIFAFGFFFALIIGFVVFGALGRTMGELVTRVIPRKRGRTVQVAAGVGIVLGLVIASIGVVGLLGQLPNFILVLIYLGSALPAAVAALR